MEKVFVVLGENGEYSDRSVWVAGVFATEAEAQQQIDARLVMRREWEAWHEAYLRELRGVQGAGKFGCYTDEQQAAAKARVPGEPSYERAERCEIEEAPLGAWI